MFAQKRKKVISLVPAPIHHKLPDGRIVTDDEFIKLKPSLPPGFYPIQLTGVHDDFEGLTILAPPKHNNPIKQEDEVLVFIGRVASENLQHRDIEKILKENFGLKWYSIGVTLTRTDDEVINYILPKLAAAGAEFFHLFRALPFEVLKKAMPVLASAVNNAPRPLILGQLSKFLAAGQSDLLHLIHKHGGNVQLRDPKYDGTVLHNGLACERNDCALHIATLHAANINFPFKAKDKEGKTHLMIAVKTGKEASVMALLSLHDIGVDIGLNEPDNNGRTPIMIAVALGFTNIVSALLKRRADITTRDNQGRSILDYGAMSESALRQILQEIDINPDRHHAALYNWLYHPESLSLYLAKFAGGDKQRILMSTKDEAGATLRQVIHLAINNPQQYEKLLEQLNPIRQSSDNRSFVEVCLANKCETNELIEQQLTALFFTACAVGDLAAVTNFILSLGVNPEAQDKLQRTALHYAVMRSELIKRTAQEQGLTVELLSCRQNKPAILKFLLQLGIEDNPNSNGHTAFELLERDSNSNNDWDRVNAIALKQAWFELRPKILEVPATGESEPTTDSFKSCTADL